jgi:hypothetical protein
MSRKRDDQVWAAGDVFIKTVSLGHSSCPLGRINRLDFTLWRSGGVQNTGLRCPGAQMVLSSVLAIYLSIL